jgi:hypothetical protein
MNTMYLVIIGFLVVVITYVVVVDIRQGEKSLVRGLLQWIKDAIDLLF